MAFKKQCHPETCPSAGEGPSEGVALPQVRALSQVRELRFLSTAALKSKDSGVNEKFDCYLNHKYYICL